MAYSPVDYILLGELLGASMNTTADQAIVMYATSYIPDKIIIKNASVSLTLAAGGIYTAASKGGTAIVGAGQVYSGLTTTTKFISATVASLTDLIIATSLFLSLTTAQGSAATVDILIFGFKIL
jgi:hypothetical protein